MLTLSLVSWENEQMKNIILLMLLSSVSLATVAAEAPQWGQYVIKFPVHNSAAAGVSFSYVGKKYAGPGKAQSAPLEKKKKETRDAEERFIANMIAINALGNREKILDLWPTAEKKAIESIMSSKEMLERNTSFFRNVKATSLISVIKYDDRYLFVVEHEVQGMSGPYMKIYPAKLEGAGYLMTNSLRGDAFYDQIVESMKPFIRESQPIK